jgi:hypothetical protein
MLYKENSALVLKMVRGVKGENQVEEEGDKFLASNG